MKIIFGAYEMVQDCKPAADDQRQHNPDQQKFMFGQKHWHIIPIFNPFHRKNSAFGRCPAISAVPERGREK